MGPLPAYPRSLRLAGWTLFGLLATSWFVLGRLDLSVTSRWVASSAVLYLIPAALTALGACALVLNTHGHEHFFWGLLAVATVVLAGTETYWTWYTAAVDPYGPRIPSVLSVFHALAAALFLGLLVSMVMLGRAAIATRARFYVDMVGAMIVASAAVYQLWTLDLFEGSPRGGWLSAAGVSAYSVVGLVIVFVSIVGMLGWRAYRWRSWERLIAAALVIYGLGLSAYPIWYHQLVNSDAPLNVSWFEVVLGLGYYLLFMAIIYRLTTAANSEILDSWHLPRPRWRWAGVAYPVVLAMALPMLGMLALDQIGTDHGIPIAVAALALAGALIVRSWLSAVERARHRELAITDPVSGAYNHRYLHERLADDLARASTTGGILALIVMDIDDFKHINNLYGHVTGDEVLCRVAEVVQSALGLSSRVFRFGSDEFAAIVPGADGERATELTRNALNRVTREISLAGTPVNLSAGVALFPRHGSDGDQLLSRAHAAQQLARVAGREDVIVYDDGVVGASDPFERLERARMRSHRATVRALAAAVDARDSDTLHHSENVAELAAALAQVLGMSEKQMRIVTLASRLHDIGKIGVRDDVLLNRKPLSAEEREHIEEHPILGERILAPAQLDEILPAVRHHHERWDGSGYPDRLRGPQIPLEARLLSVCDAFEAMTSTRTYRSAMSVGEALIEIDRSSGTQFDPDVASAFARMITHLHGLAGREIDAESAREAVLSRS